MEGTTRAPHSGRRRKDLTAGRFLQVQFWRTNVTPLLRGNYDLVKFKKMFRLLLLIRVIMGGSSLETGWTPSGPLVRLSQAPVI